MRRLLSVLMAVAWLAPPEAVAQEPVASAVLYEVNEALRFVKRGERPRDRRRPDTAEVARRVADASLLGREVNPVDTHPLFRKGSFIQADATSDVNLATGKGPIRGTMTLLTDIDPTRESLDTLVVDADLKLKGDLDLTTALQGYAGLSGEWSSVRPRGNRGTFAGLFLIPFLADGDERYFYLDLGGEADPCAAPEFVTAGGQTVPACPLESFEFALGIPLTKAVVTFFE
ncbi:MAG TPA: hypothetical protein VMT87_17210 [Vicinamibacteria bacterium]|nr:hypothetical protein [Vicinamibacteria bacterium]